MNLLIEFFWNYTWWQPLRSEWKRLFCILKKNSYYRKKVNGSKIRTVVHCCLELLYFVLTFFWTKNQLHQKKRFRLKIIKNRKDIDILKKYMVNLRVIFVYFTTLFTRIFHHWRNLKTDWWKQCGYFLWNNQ